MFSSTQKRYQAREISQALEDIQGLRDKGYSVRITGSDLLLYETLVELLPYVDQDYLLGNLFSLPKIPDEKLNQLPKFGIKRIFLTSPLSSNTAVKGNLESAIKKIHRSGLEVALTYVLDRTNIHNYESMIAEALELNADSMRFMRYLPPIGEEKTFLTDEEIEPIIRKIYKIRSKIPRERLGIYLHGQMGTWFRKEKGKVCEAGERLFIVGLDNLVYPCEFLMYSDFRLGHFDVTEKDIVIENFFETESPYHCKLQQILESPLH
jgi:MoaA/NifB/PqqE/SkfB family radical SAM enzyme